MTMPYEGKSRGQTKETETKNRYKEIKTIQTYGNNYICIGVYMYIYKYNIYTSYSGFTPKKPINSSKS